MDLKQVLVIDDASLIRESCARLLQEMGLEVVTAADGQQGLEYWSHAAFDLILLDLMLPGLNGLELLQQIAQKDPNLIIIVTTGYATIETAIEALKLGAYDYLPKPFTPQKLQSIVNKGLERRQLLLEAAVLKNERARNLLEISNERSRMQTIIDCMGEGLLATNCKSQLVLINPIAWKMLKLKGDSLIGQPVKGQLNNRDLERLITETLSRIPEASEIITRQIVFNETNSIIYSITLAPIQEESGEILGLVVLLRDISEEKKLEKTKSEFVRMVTHELKAPLGAIEGYLNLILEGLVEMNSPRQQEILRKSRNKAHALQQLVLDLLDFSLLEAGQVARDMAPLEIKDILEDVLDLMKVEAAQKMITLNLDLLPEIPKIRGDKEDLIRLFMNLVSNAIKYNHPNGRVTVQVGLEEFYLVVAVHDSGIGISEKEQAHIFREFFRVNNMFTRKVPGTGLGLSIAKKIAEAHYGYISVMSESGKGSTFSVFLPLLSSGISQSRPQTHY